MGQAYERGEFGDASIVTISTSPPEAAREWRDSIDWPHPLVLDPTRELYGAYGLERSLRGKWSLRTLIYYLRRSPQALARTGTEDTQQLGGNFVIDAAGVIRFAYRSRIPVDRPSVEALVDATRSAAERRTQP